MGNTNAQNASGSYLGYLYQGRMALLLLLEKQIDDMSICLEKFDDLSLQGDENIYVQLKHHIPKCGNLIDTSKDLWRTINSWSNSINRNPYILDNTSFILMTTNTAKESMSVYLLRNKDRDEDAAFQSLEKIAALGEPEGNKNYYSSYLSLPEKYRKKLISRIWVYDKQPNILDVENRIKRHLRPYVAPDKIDSFFYSLDGWWHQQVIKGLVSETPYYISYEDLNNYTSNLRDRFNSDDLPIDIDFEEEPTYSEIVDALKDIHIFSRQMDLIKATESQKRFGLNDFYHSSLQRSIWVRNNINIMADLELYDKKLVREWMFAFSNMKSDIEFEGYSSEKEMIQQGRNLYRKMMDKNISLRKSITEPFIMRGSLNSLANNLKIGWHPDYKELIDMENKEDSE